MTQNKHLEIAIVAAIFLIGLFLWTLPFQDNRLPFGDVDSSTHFSIADYMSQTDKPLVELPYYFSNTYYKDANNNKLWYFPQYHTSAAIFQTLSADRTSGAYIFFTLMSLLIVISIYVLIRELFGFWIAAVSSFFMVFSMRDILWHTLGVYPQVASFGLVPLFLYCVYKYSNAFLEKKPTLLYIVLGGLIIVFQVFIHPQAIVITGLTTAIYTILFSLINKKIPITIKEFGIALAIMLVLVIPFFQFFAPEQAGTFSFKPDQLGTLFSWYGNIESGMSPEYYSFSKMHPIFVAPLAIIGVILLLLRRKNEDLLMLSWLLAFYICVHLSIFGLSRSLRFLEVEGHILYPLAVMAALRIPGLIKLDSQLKNQARLGIAAILVIAIVITSAIPAYGMLKVIFDGTQRVTQPQYDLAAWLKENTGEQDKVFLAGTLGLTKKKWVRVLSFRYLNHTTDNQWELPDIKGYEYVAVDYSDFPPEYLSGVPELIRLQQSELNTFNQTGIVYNKNNIRVYKVAK